MNAAICRSCVHPRTNRKPWLVRSECAECVTDFAERHRAETGHAVELNIITIERVRRPDTATIRITGRRGW